jgi:murein DD-endopeptidase MepM/ murein hydrolase activator NlpD
MTGTMGRRLMAIVVAGTMAVGGIVFNANAGSSLDEAVAIRHELQDRVADWRAFRRERRAALRTTIADVRTELHKLKEGRGSSESERYLELREDGRLALRELRGRLRTLIRWTRGRVLALKERRENLAEWMESLPLQACPVAGPVEINDGFGDVRDMPGTPYHIHQGNDMMAPTGTPIVAPFAGNAVMEPGELGGQAVKVYGAQGYVYNAHMSAYGKLGPVQAGDVIGYVGSTGNATAPHDHFEWHPGNGEAVDPYELLMTVC